MEKGRTFYNNKKVLVDVFTMVSSSDTFGIQTNRLLEPDDADVANAMKDVKTPVLIINSKKDTMTPELMGKDIYDALPEENKCK